jgi:hypothetical protein
MADKKHKFDWVYMKRALVLFAVCAALGGGLLVGGYYFRAQMVRTDQTVHNRFHDVSQRYLSVDQEEKTFNNQHPKFVALQRRGIVGQENRLSWLEALHQASKAIKLPQLNYQLAAQTPYTPPYAVNTGNFQIFSSVMKLELGLLHEGDFLDLLEALDKNAAGTYSVSKCSFTRSEAMIKPMADHKNISASCDLQWYTINLPGAGIVMQ